MFIQQILDWLRLSQRRVKVLQQFDQPLTSLQIKRRLNMSLDAVSFIVWELSVYRLVYCLNPRARKSRLYFTSQLGKHARTVTLGISERPPSQDELPNLDWKTYGWLCYTHRAAVLKALVGPLRPSEVKRRLRLQQPDVRINVNHITEILKKFVEKDVAHVVEPGAWRPRYDATSPGRKMRELLLMADRPYRPSR